MREVVRRGVIEDAVRVRGLLADLIPGQVAVVRVAVVAVQEGIPRDLRQAGASGSVSLAVARGIERLVGEHAHDRAVASRVVEAWATALGHATGGSATGGTVAGGTGGEERERPRLVVDAEAVWGGAYTTIGEAIRAAPEGALVVVRAGRYREAVMIDKAVEVVGEGVRGGVVVEAEETDAIVIATPRAWVRNLTVRAVGARLNGSGAIWVRSGRPVIEGCDLTSSAGSVMYVTGPDSDPAVRDCEIADGKNAGIWVEENGKGTFERCRVTGNAYAGIAARTGGDPAVRDCTVTGNRDHGIAVLSGGRGTITGCTVTGNMPEGWWVEAGAGGTRRGNRPEAPQ
jgi:parallel beta-helix repeat protein